MVYSVKQLKIKPSNQGVRLCTT